MNFEHNCINDIFIYLEEHIGSRPNSIEFSEICSDSDYTAEEVKYHIQKLAEGGYLEIDQHHVLSLIFKGHEYLSVVKNNELCNFIMSSFDSIDDISMEAIYHASNKLTSDILIKAYYSKS